MAIPSSAMVVIKTEPGVEVLVSDIMGSVIVTIAVGTQGRIFTVHNNLLCEASEDFASVFTLKPDQSHAYELPTVTPEIFGFFVDYLYSRQVPGVTPAMSSEFMAKRVKQLCQFYAFGEKYKLKSDILNKTMDAIQDGFRVFGRFPEYGLVQNVYRNTAAGSMLRKFCCQSMTYNFTTGGINLDDGALQTLLKAEGEFLNDFLKDLLRLPQGHCRKDPRKRNGVGEPAQQGASAAEVVLEGTGDGYWPCWFHVHAGGWGPFAQDQDTGHYDETPVADGCHLLV